MHTTVLFFFFHKNIQRKYQGLDLISKISYSTAVVKTLQKCSKKTWTFYLLFCLLLTCSELYALSLAGISSVDMAILTLGESSDSNK